MNEALAECVEVTRRFGEFTAVDRVSLSVRHGEVVGLLGANGAGKTTLIRMLLGLLPVSDGHVRLFGQPPSRETRRRAGYVPQGLGLYDDLTIAENLAFAHQAFGGPASRYEIPPELSSFPDVVGELPLGVQRRAALTEALAHDPRILILDEPSSGVDPLARARVWETIRQALRSGGGALITTHYMDEAAECDRLVIMAGGRVVAEGTAAEIVGSGQVTVVATGSWADAFDALGKAGLLAVLSGRTLRVPECSPSEVRRALGDVPAELTSAPATLDERFVQLTRPGRPKEAAY